MDRHPSILTRKGTGLLVIDMQEKFAPVMPGFDEVVENIAKLIVTFQIFKMPILVTEQYPKGLGETVAIIEEQFKFMEIIEKTSFSCVGVEDFQKQIEIGEIKRLVVTGLESHVCVAQTVLDCLHNGIAVQVVSDAVVARARHNHEVALARMAQAGAVITTTEMCLFELAERAGTDEFKVISRLVKSRLREQSAESRVREAPAQPSSCATPKMQPEAAIPEPKESHKESAGEPARENPPDDVEANRLERDEEMDMKTIDRLLSGIEKTDTTL